jgi:ABC-type arginine/histidine transport system permease subunit
MPADAYWTLAMACNVWLTFYRKYDKRQLRSLEKYYILLCYGIPLLPALVFFGVKSESKGRMYGNATLWCWISSAWDGFRIGLFYGPVWYV